MTNREYLNTLSDEEFANVVLAKEAEIHCNNFDPELDIFDITNGTAIDFVNWLSSEHNVCEFCPHRECGTPDGDCVYAGLCCYGVSEAVRHGG